MIECFKEVKLKLTFTKQKQNAHLGLAKNMRKGVDKEMNDASTSRTLRPKNVMIQL